MFFFNRTGENSTITRHVILTKKDTLLHLLLVFSKAGENIIQFARRKTVNELFEMIVFLCLEVFLFKSLINLSFYVIIKTQL